jgi:lipoate-protein ligase A
MFTWTTAHAEQTWNQAALAVPVVQPVWQIWAYREPAVVLGCSQRPTAEMIDWANQHGVALLQRRSGGGAVLVGPWMLAVSLVVPTHHTLGTVPLLAAYRWIGTAHVRALAALGMATQAHAPSEVSPRATDPLAWACFATLSAWEVVSHDQRKLVGLAQVRTRHAVLLVAGILLEPPPWEILVTVCGHPAEHAVALAKRTVACSQLTTVAVSSVAARLHGEFGSILGSTDP